jgi:hypothetical protein
MQFLDMTLKTVALQISTFYLSYPYLGRPVLAFFKKISNISLKNNPFSKIKVNFILFKAEEFRI